MGYMTHFCEDVVLDNFDKVYSDEDSIWEANLLGSILIFIFGEIQQGTHKIWF